jgi:membrane protein DedA with SNARE-associated domain
VPIVPFAVLTFAGALPWCAGLAIAGYQVGANYDRVSGPIEKAAIVIAVLVAVALVAWFVRGRRRAGARG